ncbi:MAG: GntR family transcriptional regulator [Capsulimonadaceae bacterium]|nr:GntR family transcriptional regulator [Capsulimonadaceae bacterium]
MAEPKYQSIRDALERAIVTGEYEAGHQLPAEQDIARNFNVSLMTARRAVSDLVSADILERRARKGTFVRRRTQDRLTKPTVSIINDLYDSPFHVEIVRHFVAAVEREGWHANVIRLGPDEQDPAVRALERGDYAMLSVDVKDGSSLWHAIRGASKRLVSLGQDLSSIGIASVLTKAEDNMKLAYARLHDAGHRQIAIVGQFPDDENSPAGVVKWQKTFSDAVATFGSKLRLVRVPSPRWQSPTQKAYKVLRDFLPDNPDITALISWGDELTIGVLAACRAVDRPCPTHVSVVAFGDSPLLEHAVPAVTAIDASYPPQIDIAIDILKANQAGEYTGRLLTVAKASIVERESVIPYDRTILEMEIAKCSV